MTSRRPDYWLYTTPDPKPEPRFFRAKAAPRRQGNTPRKCPTHHLLLSMVGTCMACDD